MARRSRISITYNAKSSYNQGYSSGDRRFSTDAEFVEWLNDILEAGAPVLITSIQLED